MTRPDYRFLFSSPNFVGDGRRRVETLPRGEKSHGNILFRTFGDRKNGFEIYSVYNSEYVYLSEYEYQGHQFVVSWEGGRSVAHGEWSQFYFEFDSPIHFPGTNTPFHVKIGPLVKCLDSDNYWRMSNNHENLMCDHMNQGNPLSAVNYYFNFTDLKFEEALNSVDIPN